MNIARILNRSGAVALSPSFKIPEDGKFHLGRKGEFPGVVELAGGKEFRVIQVVDDEAIKSMVNRFAAAKQKGAPDMLVDRDHLSHDPKRETIAEGWIQNVEDRGGDLYAEIRLTAQGEHDIKGGNYRFISGEWDVVPIGQKEITPGCRVRPVELSGAGLTNRPQIKGLSALSNRETTLPDNPANSDAEQADIQNRQKNTMKQIATKLGLSADASEDAILSELGKVMNRAGTAEAALKPAQEELATVKNRLTKIEEEGAEAALETAGIKKDDPSFEIIRTTLISNREGGMALIAKIKPASQQQQNPTRITNRETAKTPGQQGIVELSPEASNAVAAKVSNRARDIQATEKSNGRTVSWAAAFGRAQAELQTA